MLSRSVDQHVDNRGGGRGGGRRGKNGRGVRFRGVGGEGGDMGLLGWGVGGDVDESRDPDLVPGSPPISRQGAAKNQRNVDSYVVFFWVIIMECSWGNLVSIVIFEIDEWYL